ncbi:MAG: carboxymuconolactone decarboxylase family protein [Chloroflexi bacterium]|nr:carboxymuconolactone decarboxylase family protein [Chloroflexota bacterium]
MSRLPNATRETFPDELKYVWDGVARDRTAGDDSGPANIFLAMGNNPALLRGYLRLANPLWANCGLDVRTRELVILRCALLQHSTYEWHQHVRIGRAAGVTDAEIKALAHWKTEGGFSDSEKALFAYADALSSTDHPGRDVFDGLAAHFEPAALVGITILVAFYFATAKFLGAMEVDTETPFVGWPV